jgi:hypothetical protein
MNNPWLDLEISKSMVHPDDKESVDFHNRNSKPKYQFLLHLAPEPWIGRVNSPVVILLANPGATELDLRGKPQYKADQIIQKSFSNIKQEEMDFPHFFFDPELDGTQGQRWYFKAFKSLLEEFSTKHISQNVMTCEMAPYHSRNWKQPKKSLPTHNYTNYLVREAMQREAMILVHRAKRLWFEMIPELEKYPKRYFPSSMQNASISLGNYKAAFEEIKLQLRTAKR